MGAIVNPATNIGANDCEPTNDWDGVNDWGCEGEGEGEIDCDEDAQAQSHWHGDEESSDEMPDIFNCRDRIGIIGKAAAANRKVEVEVLDVSLDRDDNEDSGDTKNCGSSWDGTSDFLSIGLKASVLEFDGLNLGENIWNVEFRNEVRVSIVCASCTFIS